MSDLLLEDPELWLETYGVEVIKTNTEEQVKCLCPFHEDNNPSLSINLKSQLFHCHGCKAGGDLISLLAAKKGCSRAQIIKLVKTYTTREIETSDNIPQTLLETWTKSLLRNPLFMGVLTKKGINLKTIKEYRLGLYADKKIAIPIFDLAHTCINVRLYDPNNRDNKFSSLRKGKSKSTLYPISIIKDADKIVITEGELKALLLIQNGFSAITGTAGAQTWKEEWTPFFKDKDVTVVYDIDKVGKFSAGIVTRNLYNVAKSIKKIDLPVPEAIYPNGDITDYFTTCNFTAADFSALLVATPDWKPVVSKENIDETIYELPLSKTSEAGVFGKLIRTDVVVSAKDTSPYFIPREIIVECPKDRDYCFTCGVTSNKEESFVVDENSSTQLELIQTNKDAQRKTIKTLLGIPKKCEVCNFKFNKSSNIEEIRCIPQLNIDNSEAGNVVVRAFYLGHGIETNTPYRIEGRVVADPTNQYATLIVKKAETSLDSLSTFKLNEETKESLSVFSISEDSVEAIEKKLDEIYSDLECNVTRIYKRRPLHLAYDLVWHSALYIPFQGKTVKGWAECLIIGDSGQGKSECVNALKRHYKLGELIDCKGASSVGLVGGLQETAKRWFVTWGTITLQDRRLVILEEIKGMDKQVIAKLTEVRSSGIATIIKVEKAKAFARTRMIWISNPRSDRPILGYNYGVEAIRELIGAPEDIRRFDFALCLATGEVDTKWLNIKENERPIHEAKYTSDLCRLLILWAWSRKVENIKIEDKAHDAILNAATSMSQKFVSNIPLVEGADQRMKILRLSVALAARLFSTDNGEDVIVKESHVKYIENYLTTIYSSPCCGYATYSKLLIGENVLEDREDVKRELMKLPNSKNLTTAMLEAPVIKLFTIVDSTGITKEQAQLLLGFLIRKNAIKHGRRSYYKTQEFIKLLKEINEITDELPEHIKQLNLEIEI